MTKASLSLLAPFFSCPEQILEPESACKGMEWKRINLRSETALAGDFQRAPGPPKSAQFPTAAPALSKLQLAVQFYSWVFALTNFRVMVDMETSQLAAATDLCINPN